MDKDTSKFSVVRISGRAPDVFEAIKAVDEITEIINADLSFDIPPHVYRGFCQSDEDFLDVIAKETGTRVRAFRNSEKGADKVIMHIEGSIDEISIAYLFVCKTAEEKTSNPLRELQQKRFGQAEVVSATLRLIHQMPVVRTSEEATQSKADDADESRMAIQAAEPLAALPVESGKRAVEAGPKIPSDRRRTERRGRGRSGRGEGSGRGVHKKE